MAPTTLIGQKTSTTPFGRSTWNEGYPLKVCELLAALDAPVYLERVALGSNKQIMNAARPVRRALEAQMRGLGFSLVEVLSPCPTIWKMEPVAAQHWVRDHMTRTFPLGIFRDRTRDAPSRPAPPPAPALDDIRQILGLAKDHGGPDPARPLKPPEPLDLAIKVAGFGGQGVLMLGQVLAEAGLAAGLQVSWLPSYGPEMRSGTSNCHLRIASQAIASPLVSRPNVLLALNEPSLRKFLPTVQTKGLVFYNAAECPEECRRTDVTVIAAPFTQLADRLGDARAGNMAMLGAFLASAQAPFEANIKDVLRKLVLNQRWLDIDLAALASGRQAVEPSLPSPEVTGGL